MSIIDVKSLFKEGATFPPSTETLRIIENQQYKALFEGNIEMAFPKMKERLEETFVNYKGQLIDVFEPLNAKFGKLIPKKFADFMFGRTPTVIHTKESTKDKKIRECLRKSSFWNMVKKGFIDTYRYGNGVLKHYNKLPIYIYNGARTDGEPATTPVEVNTWTPQTAQFDEYNVLGNIIGTVYNTVDEGSEYEILLEYYKSDGTFEKYVFSCTPPSTYGQVTLRQLLRSWSGKTVLDDNPVKILTGFSTTEDGIYGQSAYKMYYEILKEIIVRYTQIAKVIDKHAMPVLTGPASALSTDNRTGERYFKRGDYIAISTQDSGIKPAYLEWDGKLDASFEELDRLVGLLYQMSETGAPFLDGDTDKLGFAESARALKIRHKSPIAYANAWISQNENVIKESISDLCKIGGLDIDPEDLEITYNINLPEDELEKSQIFANKVNAGFSRIEEMKRSYRMNQDGAETEFESHLKEQQELSQNNITNKAQNDTTNDNAENLNNKSTESIRKSNDQIDSPNKGIIK